MRQCGTDFSMMQVFFPGRTRLQLKRKFFRYVLVQGDFYTVFDKGICSATGKKKSIPSWSKEL